ncbi:hypothetical protein ABQZ29_22355 [Xanthomonas sp. WHRI 10200]|nr:MULTISPECIES: hypothetical protein [unclassified Xanthomonas]MEA9589611.1 hypothetical protein [Xanthomonas sp. WHRI 10064B]
MQMSKQRVAQRDGPAQALRAFAALRLRWLLLPVMLLWLMLLLLLLLPVLPVLPVLPSAWAQRARREQAARRGADAAVGT